MYTKGDFHMHTTASDGGFSPYEVIKLAHENKFDIISITDHDTINSLDTAIKIEKDFCLKVIPGIELSTVHNNETIHILGYFKGEKYKDKYFHEFLMDLENYRIERAKQIINNLKKFFNINLDYEKILKDAKGIIARPHIAKSIIESGYNYSWEYIFSEIIGKNSPAYIPNKKISTKEGIGILKNLDAVVVLAHPVLIKKTAIEHMLKLPFDGLEAIYPLNSPKEQEDYIKLSKNTGKLITAGSDFHGINDKDTNHGRLGDVSLEGEYLKNFLNKVLN